MQSTILLLALLAQTAPAPTATSATAAPAATSTAATPAPAAVEAGPALPPNLPTVPFKGWMDLFNGKNFDGWYTFRNSEGRNNDTLGIFKVQDGAVHVMDIADYSKPQPNGYLATTEEFRNYRLRVEYQWGERKLPVVRHPEGLPRDAGLLYHMVGDDKVWPMCIEFQIQEHDTGDVWLLPNNPPNPSANSTVIANADGTAYEKQRGMYVYMEGGVPALDKGQRLYHSDQFDEMKGWNTVDLYTTDNSAVHVVNGHVNNFVSNLQLPNGGGPLSQGRIGLQQENNEVYYRNVQITPLFASRFGGPAYKILVFKGIPPETTTVTLPDGETAVAAIKKLGAQNNFMVDVAIEPAAFTDENLRQYKAVIFVNERAASLNTAQRAAFERYIHAGGGCVGIRWGAAIAGDWDWYGNLVGTPKLKATWQGPATLSLEDTAHPATSSLPLTWMHNQIWPYFKTSPRANVHVLATIDRALITDAAIKNVDDSTKEDLPMAWCHDFEGGRAFYTALDADAESISDPLLNMHLLGGIEYAAQTDGTAPIGATVLFDGKDTSHWVGKDNTNFSWNFHDGVIEPPPATYPNGTRVMVGDLHTRETYTDFQLHVEFKVPGTKSPNTRDANTNEQARGNSGVYLQGRYEMQILDSFDHPLEGKNDAGAVYEVKDAIVNASLPAEVWQSYDITFHAAKWQDGKKTASARVTAYLNSVLVQDNTEIPAATRSSMLTDDGPAPGPIALQDHLNPVQFRYIWIKPLPATN